MDQKPRCNAPCITHTHTPWAMSVSFYRRLVNTRKNCAGLEESTQAWAFSSALGKANGRLSAPSLALQDWEKTYSLKNSSPKENVKCGDVSIEKIWKRFQIPRRADRLKVFLSQCQSERLEEGNTSNVKTATQDLKESKKIKETWYYQRNPTVTRNWPQRNGALSFAW